MQSQTVDQTSKKLSKAQKAKLANSEHLQKLEAERQQKLEKQAKENARRERIGDKAYMEEQRIKAEAAKVLLTSQQKEDQKAERQRLEAEERLRRREQHRQELQQEIVDRRSQKRRRQPGRSTVLNVPTNYQVCGVEYRGRYILPKTDGSLQQLLPSHQYDANPAVSSVDSL